MSYFCSLRVKIFRRFPRSIFKTKKADKKNSASNDTKNYSNLLELEMKIKRKLSFLVGIPVRKLRQRFEFPAIFSLAMKSFFLVYYSEYRKKLI